MLFNFPSAKALRSAQNRRAYEKRTAHISKLKPTWPRIPPALKKLGKLPIPNHSHFFLTETRGNDTPCSEDGLAIWDDFPPYSMTSNNLCGSRLEALVERLHGRQFSYHKAYEADRISKIQLSDCVNDNLKLIDKDIGTLLAEWNILRSLLKSFPRGTVDHTIGHVHMQWKSRRVLALLDDWKALKKEGTDGIMTLYCTRW